METTEWLPANTLEHDMAAALERGDGATYAQLLRSARLVVPQLPAPGTEAEAQLAALFPPDAAYVPAFTSPETMVWAFGDLVEGYYEVDYAALLQRWPDHHHQLAVNPGSPIAVYLPPHAVADLADGRQSLVATEALHEVLTDEATAQLRRICLEELAGKTPDTLGLRDDAPINPLETALQAAVERSDGQAYLHALLAGDPVLLLTASPVSDPDSIVDDNFPWRVLGGDVAKVIPVFSSPAMLERAGARGAYYIDVDFLYVLASWPDDEHTLYVNPGSALELMLPGEAVMEIVASLDDSLGDE